MPDAAGYTVRAPDALPPPNMAVLRMNRRAAPELPLDLLGPFWRGWTNDAADGAGAPADYVLVTLLCAASATIGNARHVSPWRSWSEPPVLWCAAVGDPASGKSPAAGPVIRILSAVEETLAVGFKETRRRWETAKEGAAACKAKWKTEVQDAAERGNAPPMMPASATEPPEPQRPRIRANDATLEKLGLMLSGLPKGLLYHRDELAGWFGNFDRYSGGGERQFWLEANGGQSYTLDRVKHPVPVFVRHLAVAVFGGIQPDRLSAIMQDADDGLIPRFLFAWPEKAAYRRPAENGADHEAGLAAFMRLASLAMAKGGDDALLPVVVPFCAEAVEVFHDFCADMKGREAAGLLAGAYGKAPGHAARLALVLEFLWWAATPDAPEPAEISLAALNAAAALVDGYFLPMAERVFGDAVATERERHAAALARWIARTRPAKVNERALRETDRPPGLPRNSAAIKGACAELVEARWLVAPPAAGGPGRPAGDHLVNPALWGSLP